MMNETPPQESGQKETKRGMNGQTDLQMIHVNSDLFSLKQKNSCFFVSHDTNHNHQLRNFGLNLLDSLHQRAKNIKKLQFLFKNC